MAQAKYTVFVPEHIAQAVLQHLLGDRKRMVEHARIVPGHPDAAVVAFAEESPEVDSTFKQLGNFAAEAGNLELVSVVREGKSGVNVWHMRNKNYAAPSTHAELSQPTPPGTTGESFV